MYHKASKTATHRASKGGPVVIVAPPGDAHALVVATRIESRHHDVLVWDAARLPSTDQLSLYVDRRGARSVILESTACGTVNLSEVRSIWWRRPKGATIPAGVVGDFMRGYCRGEADQLFRGTLAGLQVPIYNDPDAEEKASLKAYQLTVASELGFSIPRTLITSSPEKASEFCLTSPNGIVFKPFRTPAGSQCATQEYSQAFSSKLSLLSNSPIIFQEKVPPHRDVRVSVVGRKLFAGVSDSKLLDWRVDGHLTWKAHELPAKIKRLIFAFLRKLRLTLGHFDFRLTPENEYIFFEVNPSGQFLFLEIDDHEIGVTSALADLLIGSDKQKPR